MARKIWPRLVEWLLVLALPVLLLTADLRIVTSHRFVRWEYGKADFPPDPFGLSTADRIRLAEVCVDYLRPMRISRYWPTCDYPTASPLSTSENCATWPTCRRYTAA